MAGAAPGLGAPPGLTPARAEPPVGPPPSPPENSSEENQAAPDIMQEISEKIGQQVQALLLQAKKESEAKVTTELRHFHSAMQEVDARLDQIAKQLDELDNDGPRPDVLEQSSVVQALAKVEQQWGKELCKLKSELHQTIFAHNHNADLMKHQKETLDQIRQEIDMRSAPSQNSESMRMAKSVLQKADAWQKSSVSRSKKSEPILQRLTALEQKVAAAWRWQGAAAAGMGEMSRVRAMAAMAAAQQAKSQAYASQAADFGGFYGDGSDLSAASGMYAAAKEEQGGDEDEETSLEQVLAKALAATGLGSSTG